MNTENLTTYLNDHLAGSVAALELMDHLIEVWEGTELEVTIRELKAEIEGDQDILKELLEQLGTKESVVKKAGAWIAEKVLRTKMNVVNKLEGELGMLEAFEVLSLGIEGKRCLWRALSMIEDEPPATHLDLPDLILRAEDQFRHVEELRLQAAVRAFS